MRYALAIYVIVFFAPNMPAMFFCTLCYLKNVYRLVYSIGTTHCYGEDVRQNILAMKKIPPFLLLFSGTRLHDSTAFQASVRLPYNSLARNTKNLTPPTSREITSTHACRNKISVLYSKRRSYNTGPSRYGRRVRPAGSGNVNGGGFSERVSNFFSEEKSLQQWLVYINVIFYVIQITSAVGYLPTLNGYMTRFGYRPISKSKIIEQNVWGKSPISFRLPSMRRVSSYGPFTTDFYFLSGKMAKLQPHRYLTAGFLHGSIIHLGLNMQALRRIPKMLLEGLSWPLYVASYVAAIVTGNIAHNLISSRMHQAAVPCLGASGGICGLNGLLFITLWKMGREAESDRVMRNMVSLVIYGLLTPSVSNAGHIGGFIAGVVMGYLFGPTFEKSYAAQRSRWDTALSDSNFRRAGLLKQGYDEFEPKASLKLFLAIVTFALLTKESFRSIPYAIYVGFGKPGRLGGVY